MAIGMVRLPKALETVGDMICMHILGSMHMGTPECRSECPPSLGQPWADPRCQSKVAGQEAHRAHFIFSWCNFSGSCCDTPGVPITCSSATWRGK